MGSIPPQNLTYKYTNMAQALDKDTDVVSEMKKLSTDRKVLGYTSNRFGRIVMVNKHTYNNMLKNLDTVCDENGLPERFEVLTEDEINTIENVYATKASDRKVDELNKIILSKVSKLRNFMEKLQKGLIKLEVTNLPESVFDELKKTKLQKESGITKKDLQEKDAEIERLTKELEASKKVGSTPVAPITPEAPKNTTPDEDDPFSNK